jgi:hypothetical protein
MRMSSASVLVLIALGAACGCSRAPAPAPAAPAGTPPAAAANPQATPAAEPAAAPVTTSATTIEPVPAGPSATSTIPAAEPAAPATAGFETPEAAFAALQEAVGQNDWRTAADCMTPESQEMMATGLLMAGSLMGVFGGEQAAGLNAALQKHGVEMPKPAFDFSVTQPGQEPQTAAADAPQSPTPEMPEIKDKPAFIADMLAALEKMDQGQSGQKHQQWAAATLKDLSQDGDAATASVVIQGDNGEESQPVEFRKGGGGWLVQLTGDIFGGPGGPGGGTTTTIASDENAPLTETVLEGGLKSTLGLSYEKPFESQFFNAEFPDRTLFATLSLTGEPILNAYEYGEFQVTATDDTGTALEFAAPAKDRFDKQFGSEFVDLNDFFLEKKDTLPVIFALTPPAEGAKSITIDGSIKLKVRESLIVKDVLKNIDGQLQDERLAKLGTFTVKKQSADNGEPDNGLVLEVKAPDGTVEDIKLLDGQGVPLKAASQSAFGGFSEKTFAVDTGEKLPADTQIQITLGGKESIQVVPLKIEGAELP